MKATTCLCPILDWHTPRIRSMIPRESLDSEASASGRRPSATSVVLVDRRTARFASECPPGKAFEGICCAESRGTLIAASNADCTCLYVPHQEVGPKPGSEVQRLIGLQNASAMLSKLKPSYACAGTAARGEAEPRRSVVSAESCLGCSSRLRRNRPCCGTAR
jgi:hypothetical protein